MRLGPWEHILSKFEINHVSKGIAFKYTAFGKSLDGTIDFYGHGMTADEAFNNMIQRAIKRG